MPLSKEEILNEIENLILKWMLHCGSHEYNMDIVICESKNLVDIKIHITDKSGQKYTTRIKKMKVEEKLIDVIERVLEGFIIPLMGYYPEMQAPACFNAM